MAFAMKKHFFINNVRMSALTFLLKHQWVKKKVLNDLGTIALAFFPQHQQQRKKCFFIT